MTFTTYAIGTPGQSPRMIMTASEDQVMLQIQSGEVYFSIYNYPAPPHQINAEGTQLISTIDLTYRRDNVWNMVKSHRDLVVQGGCVTAMGPIDTDPNSRLNLQDAVRNFRSQTWTMKDSSRVPITSEQLVDMADTVSLFVQQCYENAFAQKDAIYSSDTPETIDITAGYPSNACYVQPA